MNKKFQDYRTNFLDHLDRMGEDRIRKVFNILQGADEMWEDL